MRQFAVIDAPSMLGVGPTGVEELPTALKAAGLMLALDASYVGRVDVPPYNPVRDAATSLMNPHEVREFALRLADAIGETLNKGLFPLVLGGDCSIELGTALALRRRGRYGLFFLDGHADFYQPQPDADDNEAQISSMELALITGYGPDLLTNIDGLKPYFRETDVTLFGIRDAEEAARDGSPDVRESSMHIFDLAKVRQLGVAEAARSALNPLLSDGLQGFWIHLDADVLSDSIMPAVDWRVPGGGLTFAELSHILRLLLVSGRAVGMSVTILNPRLDSDGSIVRDFVACLVDGMTA
ncbi:MAG: arginase family protein [Burkholderiales bacterium]|nr:arginase family protein [Anaerolineae bacterium]